MTMFGLKESEAAQLARVLVREDLGRDDAREVVARAMWTGIVEPGDRAAGLIVSVLGAAAALDLVAEGRSVSQVVAALGDAASARAATENAAAGNAPIGGMALRNESLSDEAVNGAAEEGSLLNRDFHEGAGASDGGGANGKRGGSTLGAEVTLERDIAKALARWKPRLMPSSALVGLRTAERIGVRLLVPWNPQTSVDRSPFVSGWPEGLDDLGFHAPLALWWRGVDEALPALANSIALVGARAATGYGEHVTMEASAGLVDRGYAIVSGAAYGIDGMAHRAALASDGITVAFLAGGVDRFYPSGHDGLLTRIADTGAVMSELPCGEPPTKWRFLQRNRLIAAASNATIVLEAGWRSGSLNTAGHAAALARPLGAVPGPVTSAASAGCHRLIREFDAVCVTNPEEMAELAPFVGSSGAAESNQLSGLESISDAPSVTVADRPSLQVRVLDALSNRSPRSSIDVAARCGLAASTVQGILGVLELEGKVVERPGGWIVR